MQADRAQVAQNRSAIRPTFLQGRLQYSGAHPDGKAIAQRSYRPTKATKVDDAGSSPSSHAEDEVEGDQATQADPVEYAGNEASACAWGDPVAQAQQQDLVRLSEAPSEVVQKVQLRSRFFDIHFGAASHAPLLFINDALDFPHPRKSALIAAMDTLCVAQLATSFRDEHLVAVSKVLYGRAIHCLNEKIGFLSRRKRIRQGELDDVVGSISALVPATWFDCIGAAKGEWMRHTQGLDRVIETYGSQSLSPAVRDQFYRHWERRSFGYILLSGRAVPPRTLRESKKQTDGDSLFKTCALNIPGLLGRARDLLKRDPSQRGDLKALMSVLTKLSKCVSEIKRWQLHWNTELPQGYEPVNIRVFESFIPLCKNHKDVFQTAYRFDSPVLERDLRLSNICLISVLQAILDIAPRFASLLGDEAFQLSLKVANSSAKTSADNLCMHVPWNAQAHNGSFACTYSWMPLYHASSFYRKNGFNEELGWCEEVSKSLSSKHGITVKFFPEDED